MLEALISLHNYVNPKLFRKCYIKTLLRNIVHSYKLNSTYNTLATVTNFSVSLERYFLSANNLSQQHYKFSCACTGCRTKCHTIDCARNKFLLLQKHLIPGTELILIGWEIVPNEEHVQCDHSFASQPLANEPLHSSQLFDTILQKARGTT